MQSTFFYSSPLGKLTLTADPLGLTGLWFPDSLHFSPEDGEDLPVFRETCRWLDMYFSGREPDFLPPLHLTGTAFQKLIWELLLTIPYGRTVTYGQLARQAADRLGKPRMSAQAVGGAVGRNPVSILVPCHRVLGANGSLTGYAGGLSRKAALLKLEGADMDSFSLPRE